MRRKFKASYPLEAIDGWSYERSIIDKTVLSEIQGSIQRSGVITPLILRELDDKTIQGLGGFLRSSACAGLGISTAPAMIYSQIDDLTAMDITLIDNIQHAEMSDWDIAQCLKVYREQDLNLEDIATRIQKSTSYISQKLAVLNDSFDIQEAVENGRLSESQARYVRRLPEELHEEAIEAVEDKTVRETRIEVIGLQEQNRAVLIRAEINEINAELKKLDELDKSRENIRSEVSKLEGQLKALKVSNKQMNGILRTVETLEKDYFPTVKELEAYNTELAETRKQLPDYDVDDLVKDRKALDAEIGRQDAKIKKARQELNALIKDNKTSKKDRKRVQEKISEFNERQRKVRELSDLTEKLNDKVAKFDEKLGDAVGKYDSLKATLADYERDVLDQRLELSRQIVNLKKEIGSLNGKIGQRSRLDKELIELKQELTDLEAEVETTDPDPEKVTDPDETGD